MQKFTVLLFLASVFAVNSRGLASKYMLEHPLLCIFDIRIATTLFAIFIAVLIISKRFFPPNRPLGEFARCMQAVLLGKFILILFAMFLYPQVLRRMSNTIEFTKTFYIVMFLLDFLLFLIFTFLPAEMDHSFGASPILVFITYFAMYNTWNFLGIDIYRYQLDLKSTAILCTVAILATSFYAAVLCPSISAFLRGKNKNYDY